MATLHQSPPHLGIGQAPALSVQDLTDRFQSGTSNTGLQTPPATPIPVSVVQAYPTIHCTKEVPFEPVVENLRSEGTTYYQSIICQGPYTNASFEELRYVDYFNELRFGRQESHSMSQSEQNGVVVVPKKAPHGKLEIMTLHLMRAPYYTWLPCLLLIHRALSRTFSFHTTPPIGANPDRSSC